MRRRDTVHELVLEKGRRKTINIRGKNLYFRSNDLVSKSATTIFHIL